LPPQWQQLSDAKLVEAACNVGCDFPKISLRKYLLQISEASSLNIPVMYLSPDTPV
jgi:hypothetical protein